MLDSFDLIMLRNVAITDCSKDSLVDLRDVKIDVDKPVHEKMTDFFEQIKNPYLFKIGDMKVKISFAGKRTFSEALEAAISSGANYQSNLG